MRRLLHRVEAALAERLQPAGGFGTAATVQINDQRYFYRMAGVSQTTRLPLILIHGLGVSSAYWARLLPLLATERPVYAIDLPGFGRTEDPPNVLNTRQLAQAVHLWQEALGIGKAHLLAHSQGAQIATELTNTWPNLTQTLTLIGPTLGERDPSLPRMAMRLLRTAPREDRSLLPVVVRAYLRSGAYLMVRTCHLLSHEDSVAAMQTIQCPTLLIRGGNDPIVTGRALAILAEAGQHTQQYTIPDAPHGIHWSHAATVASYVNRFLAQYDQQDRGDP